MAAQLAAIRPAPSRPPPDNTTRRVPIRSDIAPQNSDANPMHRKSIIAALEIVERDHPVATDIGCRKTPSDSAVPNPMQVMTMPAPTMTQP